MHNSRASGAVASVQPAPIAQLALLLVWKLCQPREPFRVCLFWAFQAWFLCLDTTFQSLECVRVFFDWFLALILRVFACFRRFHIVALGHLVALCMEPSIGFSAFCRSIWLFGHSFAPVQWLLSLLLDYSSDLPLFRLVSTWLRFEPRSHGSLRFLALFLVMKDCLFFLFGDLIGFHWVKFSFCSLLLFLKICSMRFAIKKKKQTISPALY